jgi:hypothetical protein
VIALFLRCGRGLLCYRVVDIVIYSVRRVWLYAAVGELSRLGARRDTRGSRSSLSNSLAWSWQVLSVGR